MLILLVIIQMELQCCFAFVFIFLTNFMLALKLYKKGEKKKRYHFEKNVFEQGNFMMQLKDIFEISRT